MTTWKPLTFLKPKTGICLRFCSKASECMRSVGWGQAALQAGVLLLVLGQKYRPRFYQRSFVAVPTNRQPAVRGTTKRRRRGKIFPIKRQKQVWRDAHTRGDCFKDIPIHRSSIKAPSQPETPASFVPFLVFKYFTTFFLRETNV